VRLGDSDMPWAPAAGGSGLTGALGNAVDLACKAALNRFVELGRHNGEPYADVLARHGLTELTTDAESAPPDAQALGMAASGAFAAKFVEVHVDRDLGVIRIARIVTVVDGGRILNEKLARSQIIGGTIGGIGQALFEETITDAETGRIANATFGDYLIPVNADVPDIDVAFVGGPDRMTPTGTKGIGEVGLAGIAPAVANAVFHATGKRIRSLPITIDRLLEP
jgi:CO/xanthine dehydrogenase Mo-binding subunit